MSEIVVICEHCQHAQAQRPQPIMVCAACGGPVRLAAVPDADDAAVSGLSQR